MGVRRGLVVLSFCSSCVLLTNCYTVAPRSPPSFSLSVRRPFALAASTEDEDPFAEFDPRISPLSQRPASSTSNSGTGSMDITSSVAKSVEKAPPKTPRDGGANSIGNEAADDADLSSLTSLLSINEQVVVVTDPASTDDDDAAAVPQQEDPFADFDPRISPHMYPGGINAASSRDDDAAAATPAPPKIGVILIDHGSKRQASNEHLESVARAYQQRCPPHFVVVAAHMEIAPPSIADQVERLVFDRGVDDIVCHPYFLSPGRHVMQDIPELVKEASANVESRLHDNDDGRKVRIVTTNPTGSQLQHMLDAVASSVEKSVKRELAVEVGNNGSELGGFFGDVMRMMEEAEANNEVTN